MSRELIISDKSSMAIGQSDEVRFDELMAKVRTNREGAERCLRSLLASCLGIDVLVSGACSCRRPLFVEFRVAKTPSRRPNVSFHEIKTTMLQSRLFA